MVSDITNIQVHSGMSIWSRRVSNWASKWGRKGDSRYLECGMVVGTWVFQNLLIYWDDQHDGCQGMVWKKIRLVSCLEFTVLKWPPQSPDLHLTGHIWDVGEQESCIMDAQPTDQNLSDAIMSIRTKMSGECCQHFLNLCHKEQNGSNPLLARWT